MKLFNFQTRQLDGDPLINSSYLSIVRTLGAVGKSSWRIIFRSPFTNVAEYVCADTFENKHGRVRNNYMLLIRRINNTGPMRFMFCKAQSPVK